MILMTRTIEICKPKKNKNYGYTIIFNYKNTGRNPIQARSKCGRSRGMKGEVFINGNIDWPSDLRLNPLQYKKIIDKIDLALDLTYSISRLEKPKMLGNKIVAKTLNLKNYV